MKRKISIAVAALALAGCFTFTSCIGSFGLTKKVLDWNKSVGDKWVNELVFLALSILPVYEITVFADVIVLNTIEFWTGNNPIADAGTIQQIEGENGIYTVETLENGYTLTNEAGNQMNLIFDEETNTWSAVSGENEVKVVTLNEGGDATVYLPNGETRNVELSEGGVLALRQEVSNSNLAAK
ncbi:MAG: DUF3332 domain-containing protein [Lentimicrobiaceae bacterium]|jgi:hypothetical protein|nr:DUF3332 domain-containing protein [Lentimicrobiaceae bacterium]